MSSSAPIRVLHLRDSPWVDGPGRTILETGAHLDPALVDFHIGVLCPDSVTEHPLLAAARARGIQAHAIVDDDRAGSKALAHILELVDRHRINVIHSSEFRSHLLAQRCKRRRNLRAVATAHGWIANNLRRKLVRSLDKFLLGLFDRVIFVSSATRALVPRWWLPESRTHTLHNALVLGVYGKDAAQRRERSHGDGAPITLLNVGRLSAEKGQLLLLEALATLAPTHPTLRLQIAGVGPLEEALRARVHELGLATRVDFLGYVAQMPPLYSKVDLVVQSSYTEGLPNVILEAAYLRVPILATRVGGTAEVVTHGESAWLVNPGSADELVRGMDQFVRNRDEFVAMAERARRGIEENFSFAARTAKLTQIYMSLVRA